MTITANEQAAETKATDLEGGQNPKFGAAASDWFEIGVAYEKQGQHDQQFRYNCEAGRAFSRSARDYAKAGDKQMATDALERAANAFRACGSTCTETGDFAYGEMGFSQAALIYDRMARDAKAAGDKDSEEKAKKNAHDAGKASARVRELRKLE